MVAYEDVAAAGPGKYDGDLSSAERYAVSALRLFLTWLQKREQRDLVLASRAKAA